MHQSQQSNRDIIRRDRDLPGLRLLLEPGALAEALKQYLPDVALGSAVVTYLRYKPGVNCLAKCRLECAGQTIDAHLKLYGADVETKLSKDRLRPAVAGPLGRGRVVLDEHAGVLSTFPNDAKLPALARLTDEVGRSDLLTRVFDLPNPPTRCRLTTLAYKPERRFVAQLRMGELDPVTLKLYSSAHYVTAPAAIRSETKRDTLLPQLVGQSRKHRILAFRWLDGVNLRDVVFDTAPVTAAAQAAGATLASLHRESGRRGRPEASKLGERVAALASQLAFLCPALSERARRLAGQLTAWLATRPPGTTLIHGDFYDKQILLHDGNAQFLDFDNSRLGDAHYDLGLFVAHLERHSLNDKLDSQRVDTVTKALLSGYESARGQVDERTLWAYTAIGLFELIHHPFRDLSPDWPTQVDELLERATTLFARARLPKQLAETS